MQLSFRRDDPACVHPFVPIASGFCGSPAEDVGLSPGSGREERPSEIV